MKERGIIFNTEMVRAIINGRKTQTRRIVKHQRHPSQEIKLCDDGFFHWSMIGAEKPLSAINYEYGRVGDRLWVRETWQGPLVDSEKAYDLFKDPAPYQKVENCVYKADGGHAPEYIDFDDNFRQGWRPSIHMPRWASRITLEITDVRVERLQEASDDDFKAEGYPLERELTGGSTDAFCWFRNLWDSISKPECNFESNPWVWVIEFKRV
ncbi:hypothetical protein AB7309_18115 [Providencia manganoxydans]|uniref:hypothetical protein n=1 Tax=Providencia manganoxydans TaxID=2923283 RepID=UPI0034E4CA8C